MTRLHDVDLAHLRGAMTAVPPAPSRSRVLVRDRGVPLTEVEVDGWGEQSRDAVEAVVAPLVRLRRRLADPPLPGDAEDITVVVCTRNRPLHLDACLRAIAALDPSPGEVLVVDNASSSTATRDVAAAHGVGYVLAPEPGLDRARNVGWRHARGSVVAYLDDDTRVDPAWAGTIARTLATTGADVVTGLVLPAEVETGAQLRYEARGGMRKGFVPQTFHRDTNPVGLDSFRLGVGANMAYRKVVLEAVGGFDERLDVGTATRGGGDLDTLWWAVEHGFVVRYEPSMLIRHVHRRSARGVVRQLHDNGVGFSAWFAKVEAADPARADEVRRARRVWWLKRHLRGLVRAVRSRDPFELVLVLAEAEGALHGARRFRLEAAQDHDPWPLPGTVDASTSASSTSASSTSAPSTSASTDATSTSAPSTSASSTEGTAG